MKVYADNAATTKMSKIAVEALIPYMENIYGNPSSLHSAGQEAATALLRARESVAAELGCEAREIYFTSGGSEADNQAIISAARLGTAKGKKHIVSTVIEHHAVLHTLKRLKKEGFEITLLPVAENGVITPEQVKSAVRDDTCLVTVMFANNEIGTVQPIAEIGRICKEKNVIFHTDAVQAAGHLHINVRELRIDMLSLSAHKFHGPKGVGVLYARRGIALTNLIDGGAQERGRRGGTENVGGCVALASAFSEACAKIDETNARLLTMRERLTDGLLAAIPKSILNGDREKRLAGNINICFEGIEGESILLLLDAAGIMASSGSACTSGSLDPSHVLLAIGRPHEIAHGSLRISLSEYNTDEEIDYMLKTIPAVIERLRNMSPVWRDLKEGKRNYVIQ